MRSLTLICADINDVKIQLLPSSCSPDPSRANRQHLTTFVVDDLVAIDAGCLGFAVSDEQRGRIRDVVLTHAHLDHIAGLPIFLDDLFSTLREPVRVHAAEETIAVVERDIFNWSVYPRFSELQNEFGDVISYQILKPNAVNKVAHLTFRPLAVNHKVPSFGFVVSDGETNIALTGDTAETEHFWSAVNSSAPLDALFVECAFPDALESLAMTSFHMTPARLHRELQRAGIPQCPIFAVNLKPMFCDRIAEELSRLQIANLQVLQPGRVYEF